MNTASDVPNYLILGATGAVGSALARRLSERGAHVIVAGRRLDALEALADDWFLGAESAWVTGQVWGVDGGLATLKARAPKIKPRPKSVQPAA